MKTNCHQTLIATALTCALASLATAAHANDTGAGPAPAETSTNAPAMDAPADAMDADGWKFGVSLPLWAPQVNGNATVRGYQEDVNVNFSQLKDHLDTSLGIALNAQKDKFGLFGNVGYMKFSGGFDDEIRGNFSAQLKFLIANAGVSYELVRTKSDHPFILAGTAGLRYWYASTRLSYSGVFFSASGGNTYNIYDPVLGLRASQYLIGKLHLDVGGDGGGFNANNSTDWTWSASAMLTYDFAKWCSLSAGYQAVALDESNGSGTDKKGVDLIFSGVAGALTFKF